MSTAKWLYVSYTAYAAAGAIRLIKEKRDVKGNMTDRDMNTGSCSFNLFKVTAKTIV